MRVVILAGLAITTRVSAEPPPPYRELFVRGAKWSLPCVKTPAGLAGSPTAKSSPDGTLECEITELQAIGGAKLAHLECRGSDANPTGWYAMIDRGLYRIDQWSSDTPPRPRARWQDYQPPPGSFRASDVASLRALHPLMPSKPVAATWNDPPHPSGWTGGGASFQRTGAWCASRGGSNGGGGEWTTLCVSEKGLVGSQFDKGGASLRWSCGVLP